MQALFIIGGLVKRSFGPESSFTASYASLPLTLPLAAVEQNLLKLFEWILNKPYKNSPT